MIFKFSAVLLGVVTLALAPAQRAFATGYELVNVLVTSYAGGKAVAQARTDGNGGFVFKDLAPGTYTLKVDGPSLATAVAKSKQSARSVATSPVGQSSPLPAPARAATGLQPAVGDVNGDGTADISLLIGLLLPAVQKNVQASPAPQSFQQKATARGAEVTFTVPVTAGPTSSWKGTLERQK